MSEWPGSTGTFSFLDKESVSSRARACVSVCCVCVCARVCCVSVCVHVVCQYVLYVCVCVYAVSSNIDPANTV
uniref:Uncharacterized protein n=1 Tax=Anguilla anguilla TaxID=7936 RepID=A0A0E9V1P2_ANGAN